MTTRYKELPGLCDESRRVLAFPPPAPAQPRARWLPKPQLLAFRLAVLATVAAIALGIGCWIGRASAPACDVIRTGEVRT